MIRTLLSFREFYDICRRSAEVNRYRVIVTLVARDADASSAYDELLSRWSSLHDLTGPYVAFLFAGSKRQDDSQLAWREYSTEYVVPSGVSLASPERLLSRWDAPFGHRVELTPIPPERSELATSHTLRITELKDSLGILERDVPCLHFHFVCGGTGRIVRLADVHGSIYAYLKCLLSSWETSFAIDSQRKRILTEAAAANHVRITKEGQARRRLHATEEAVRRLQGESAAIAAGIIALLPEVASNRRARRSAFEKMSQLRTFAAIEEVSQILPDLNSLIDLAPQLYRSAERSAKTSTLATESDQHLIMALDGCRRYTNSDNSKTPPEWRIFIAHAGDDAGIAERLFELLNPSVPTFLDTRCLRPGDDWYRTIPRAHHGAVITIVLISTSTERAYYEHDEIILAISRARGRNADHRVIPVLLPGTPITAVPYGLNAKQHIRMLQEEDVHDVAARVLAVYQQSAGPREAKPRDAG